MTTTKRERLTQEGRHLATPTAPFREEELEELEKGHPEGLGVQEIVEAFTAKGERLTEATFRKYVQLGLLPRSRRVGRKGKNRGSLGLYPATTVRQLAHLRHLMGLGFTIDEIQREFLFVRGDIEALGRQLERVYAAIEQALQGTSARVGGGDEPLAHQLEAAREVGEDLLRRLEQMERHLTMSARMSRATL
ncbi:MAG: MerR family transcriptional regulator [Myxococcales bacterium]|nr:MerR family transcriptional regulator [Myxococcales bacterium]